MEPAIRVEGVSKRYSRHAQTHLSYGVTDLMRENVTHQDSGGLGVAVGQILQPIDEDCHARPLLGIGVCVGEGSRICLLYTSRCV